MPNESLPCSGCSRPNSQACSWAGEEPPAVVAVSSTPCTNDNIGALFIPVLQGEFFWDLSCFRALKPVFTFLMSKAPVLVRGSLRSWCEVKDVLKELKMDFLFLFFPFFLLFLKQSLKAAKTPSLGLVQEGNPASTIISSLGRALETKMDFGLSFGFFSALVQT